MESNFFILTKDSVEKINSDEYNEFFLFENKKIYILPSINFSYYEKNGFGESSLIDWCDQFCDKNKIFLDIGARGGTYSISLAPKCKHVYSFEPRKMTYYSLCGSVALSNLKNINE